MNRAQTVINTIKTRGMAMGMPSTAPVGVVSSFGSDSVVDEKNRDIIWIANTDAIDLEREVVVPEGGDGKGYFFKNRKIFVDHDYRIQCAIGVLRSAVLTTDAMGRSAWRVRAHILSLEGNPLPDDVLTFAREAGGIGSSIGFAALDAGKPTKEEAQRYTQDGEQPESIVRKWLWLELSATAIPMNVTCQSLSDPTYDQRALNTLDELVTKSKIKRASAVALGLPTTPVRRAFAAFDSPRRAVVELG